MPTDSMSSLPRQHVRCVFTGNVQGVSFRYAAFQVAKSFDVAGYVRNLPDGSVELVAEGGPQTIDAFIAAIEKRMAAYIRNKQVTTSPDLAGYTKFEIRF